MCLSPFAYHNQGRKVKHTSEDTWRKLLESPSQSVIAVSSNLIFSLHLCLERVGEMKPAIEAKRFKHDDEDDEDDDMDSEDKQQQMLVGLTEDAPAVGSEAALLTDEEKIAQMKANKNLDERQREFKEMLLERGVSIPYSVVGNFHWCKVS